MRAIRFWIWGVYRKNCFIAFLDYFGRFSTSKLGGNIDKNICPQNFESKIGSKEPKNRQKNLYGTLPSFFLFLPGTAIPVK